MSRWGGLLSPVTPRAMLAGVLHSWQGHPCQTGRRVGARQRVIPMGPPGWELSRGVITFSCKKKRIITETRSRVNSLFQRGTVAVPHKRELMKHGSQSQQDASRLMKPLLKKGKRQVEGRGRRCGPQQPIERSGKAL